MVMMLWSISHSVISIVNSCEDSSCLELFWKFLSILLSKMLTSLVCCHRISHRLFFFVFWRSDSFIKLFWSFCWSWWWSEDFVVFLLLVLCGVSACVDLFALLLLFWCVSCKLFLFVINNPVFIGFIFFSSSVILTFCQIVYFTKRLLTHKVCSSDYIIFNYNCSGHSTYIKRTCYVRPDEHLKWTYLRRTICVRTEKNTIWTWFKRTLKHLKCTYINDL